MVLDAENGLILVPHPFDRLIIEVDSIHDYVGGEGLRVHCKAVVLGGDLNFAGGKIFDRLIGATMAEFEFESLAAEGLSEDLVTQANPKNRHATLEQVPGCLHSIPENCWIPGAIRKEDSRGFVLQNLGG